MPRKGKAPLVETTGLPDLAQDIASNSVLLGAVKSLGDPLGTDPDGLIVGHADGIRHKYCVGRGVMSYTCPANTRHAIVYMGGGPGRAATSTQSTPYVTVGTSTGHGTAYTKSATWGTCTGDTANDFTAAARTLLMNCRFRMGYGLRVVATPTTTETPSMQVWAVAPDEGIMLDYWAASCDPADVEQISPLQGRTYNGGISVRWAHDIVYESDNDVAAWRDEAYFQTPPVLITGTLDSVTLSITVGLWIQIDGTDDPSALIFYPETTAAVGDMRRVYDYVRAHSTSEANTFKFWEEFKKFVAGAGKVARAVGPVAGAAGTALTAASAAAPELAPLAAIADATTAIAGATAAIDEFTRGAGASSARARGKAPQPQPRRRRRRPA